MLQSKLTINLLRIAGYFFTGVGAIGMMALWEGGPNSQFADTVLQDANGKLTGEAYMLGIGLVLLGATCTTIAMIALMLRRAGGAEREAE